MTDAKKNATSVAMHAFHKEREAWKAGGKQGPEPVRPESENATRAKNGAGKRRTAK